MSQIDRITDAWANAVREASYKWELGVHRVRIAPSLAPRPWQGREWLCLYCGGCNRIPWVKCIHCGAPRTFCVEVT